MRIEVKNRLDRQTQLGVDKGMRLKLAWQSGFTVTVHSWEAAAVILKQGITYRSDSNSKASSFRQSFYAGRYADGVECQNPDTLRHELCFITLEQNARRGAPRDPEVTQRKRVELQAKITKLEQKLEEAKKDLAAL